MADTKGGRGMRKARIAEELETLRASCVGLIDRWIRMAVRAYENADEQRAKIASAGATPSYLLSSWQHDLAWYRQWGDENLYRAHVLAKETGLIEQYPQLLVYDAWQEEERLIWRVSVGLDQRYGLVVSPSVAKSEAQPQLRAAS